MSKDIRASRPAVTPYKKVKKPLMSKEEMVRQRASKKSYFIGTGDDAS